MQKYLDEQIAYFKKGNTLSFKARKDALETLKSMIEDNQQVIMDALKNDLSKSDFESYATEIGFTLYSIRHTLKHLKKWMKKKKVKTPMFHLFTKSYLVREPLGSVLILAPFNYPFQLLIEPLIGALSAGNTAVVKPSELTPHTEAVLKDLIERYFDPSHVRLVTGDGDIAKTLTSLPFDHIFFTGSIATGKKVYQAAAKNLVPVTLELGGKSPAIVTKTANLEVAAKRIVYGKFINAGQTCIAPDYVYIDETSKEAFIKHLKDAIEKMYPLKDDTIGTLVNKHHYERIKNLINESKVINDYETDELKKKITPVVMDDVSFDDIIMQEEIFGPVLPVVTYKTHKEAITTLNSFEKPLALYVFSENKKVQNWFIQEVSSGSAAINDTITQVANPHLPFGGVGQSGIGRYHGKYSFDTFSHIKSFVKKKTLFDPPLVYPPYGKRKLNFIKRIFK
jgi:aldehyde dehydrogenase (NAD+)